MSTFSASPVVIDGKGHLLGRLASVVSKQVCRADMNSASDKGNLGHGGDEMVAERSKTCE
jgi:ribosomal protein L13